VGAAFAKQNRERAESKGAGIRKTKLGQQCGRAREVNKGLEVEKT